MQRNVLGLKCIAIHSQLYIAIEYLKDKCKLFPKIILVNCSYNACVIIIKVPYGKKISSKNTLAIWW